MHLTWQHDCYRFRPQDPEVVAEPGLWRVPIFPNGDYYIFVASDLQYGLFGHPWEHTICVFGERLLEAYAGNEPRLFERIVRINGSAA